MDGFIRIRIKVECQQCGAKHKFESEVPEVVTQFNLESQLLAQDWVYTRPLGRGPMKLLCPYCASGVVSKLARDWPTPASPSSSCSS